MCDGARAVFSAFPIIIIIVDIVGAVDVADVVVLVLTFRRSIRRKFCFVLKDNQFHENLS